MLGRYTLCLVWTILATVLGFEGQTSSRSLPPTAPAAVNIGLGSLLSARDVDNVTTSLQTSYSPRWNVHP